MALGNNLKKKKLIPDSEGDKKSKKETVKSEASESPKKAPKKEKKSPKPKPKKAAVPIAKAAPKPTKKPESKPPVKEEATVQPEALVRVKEDVPKKPEIPAIEAEPVTTSPSSQTGDVNPILSAYSVYIAQELHERKTTLRKRYISEVTDLQGQAIQFILVTIGGEQYALDIDCVKEVVPLSEISKIPNTPDHIKGVSNVRGSNYVVYDLSTKFKVVGGEIPRYLLVLSNRELKSSIPLAILPTTFKTNGNSISHSLQLIEDTLLDASYIKGIIQDGEQLIYYLDIVELLKNDKAIVIPDNLVEKA